MRRCLPRRTPSVCFSAMNLLHHWQQQDPTLWPMPHKKQQLPGPRAGFAASGVQQQQQQSKQNSLQMPTANQALQGMHTWEQDCILVPTDMYYSTSIQPQASREQEQLFLLCLCRPSLCSQRRQQ